jgi:6-phosphogluconolactonase (cycloisomerase 2 family)
MTSAMYVSLQGDDTIVRFALDPATGDLERLGETAVSGGPAPMAVDPARQVLHVARRGERKISSFRIDRRRADLARSISIRPDDSCMRAASSPDASSRIGSTPAPEGWSRSGRMRWARGRCGC